MPIPPREKNIVIIGDVITCLIGVAAGLDHLVFRENCKDIDDFISENIDRYGVFIVTREVANACRESMDKLEEAGVLAIVIESPRIAKEVEPRKFYEGLIAKFIGMGISLKE
ncbi:MAG: hypothetical protein DRO13_01560 [Thermoprotei archaeon]|nr:MAG: hypothetical protein DRO13_01560 [Thermoprotei archaeon]